MFGKNQQIRIAISGKRKTGKNTVATLIVQHLELKPDEYKIAAFADKIKDTVKGILPWVKDEYLYGRSELREELVAKEKDFFDADGNPLTIRKVCTDIGKLGRGYNPNLWIMHFENDFQASQNKKLYIASDCRMINEFNYARQSGFYTIRVKRLIQSDINSTDISETEQEEIPDSAFDKVIDNNISYENLSNKIKDLVEELRLK